MDTIQLQSTLRKRKLSCSQRKAAADGRKEQRRQGGVAAVERGGPCISYHIPRGGHCIVHVALHKRGMVLGTLCLLHLDRGIVLGILSLLQRARRHNSSLQPQNTSAVPTHRTPPHAFRPAHTSPQEGGGSHVRAMRCGSSTFAPAGLKDLTVRIRMSMAKSGCKAQSAEGR